MHIPPGNKKGRKQNNVPVKLTDHTSALRRRDHDKYFTVPKILADDARYLWALDQTKNTHIYIDTSSLWYLGSSPKVLVSPPTEDTDKHKRADEDGAFARAPEKHAPPDHELALLGSGAALPNNKNKKHKQQNTGVIL